MRHAFIYAALLLLVFTALPARAEEINRDALAARLLPLDTSPLETMLTVPPVVSHDCLEVTSVTRLDDEPAPRLLHLVSVANGCDASITFTSLLTGDTADTLKARPQEVQGSDVLGNRYTRTFSTEGAQCVDLRLSDQSGGPRLICRTIPLAKNEQIFFTVTSGGYYKLTGYSWPTKEAYAPISANLVSVEGRRTQSPLNDKPDLSFVPPGPNAAAQVELGDMFYILGDKDKARDWWEQAKSQKAEHNSTGAFNATRRLMMLGGSEKDATAWLLESKEKNRYVKGGDCELGARYLAGRGVAADADKAYEYWGMNASAAAAGIKARALAGHARSQYEYGQMLATSLCAGTMPVIWDEALKWFAMAAARGYPLAQYRVGLHAGATGDDATAQQLLEKAAAQELPEAALALGMRAMGRDDAAATVWLRKAATLGNSEAAGWLALLNLGVWGSKSNEEEAYFWLKVKGVYNGDPALPMLAQLENALGLAKAEAVRKRAAEVRPPWFTAQSDNFLPSTTGTAFVTAPVRAAAESAYWTYLPAGFTVDDVPNPVLLQRKVMEDAGPPSPPTPQSFTLYRINEFSGDGKPHVAGFSASARTEKELVYASFDSLDSSCQLLAKSPLTGQEIVVTGSGAAEFVEHNGRPEFAVFNTGKRHGLAIYDIKGAGSCKLQAVARVSASQQVEDMPPAGSLLPDHDHELQMYLLRHLEFSSNGKTAKLVSRSIGVNGFDTYVLTFRDITSAAFNACRSLLDKQLPEDKTLFITGMGVGKDYMNDDVHNLQTFDFASVKQCELSNIGVHDIPNGYTYYLYYLPLRHGVDIFPSIVQPAPLSATPQEDWQHYLEQGAMLTSRKAFGWGKDEALLTAEGEAQINNARTTTTSAGPVTVIFTDIKDPVLNACKPLMMADIPAGKKLSIYGFGSSTSVEKEGVRSVTHRLSRVLECKLEPAINQAVQEAINAPAPGLNVASMTIGGATFWLRYIGQNDDKMERKTEAMLKAGDTDGSWYPLAPGEISSAEAWLKLVKAARRSHAKPMRLGNLALTVEGNTKAGAAAVKAYAEADSTEHMYMLGHLYFHGAGVEKDTGKAWYWFDRAIHNGMGSTPWTQHFAQQDADAVETVMKLEPDGKRKKIKFLMPGEEGAPPPVDVNTPPDIGIPAMADPASGTDEGLKLYGSPYSQE